MIPRLILIAAITALAGMSSVVACSTTDDAPSEDARVHTPVQPMPTATATTIPIATLVPTSTPKAIPAAMPTTTPTALPTALPTPTAMPTSTPAPSATPTSASTPTTPVVTIGDVPFGAEIADTAELRSKGLGERDSLPKQTGMLFLFPDRKASLFWMKGMRFPLDFVWIGEDCSVVDLTQDVPHLPPDAPVSDFELFTSASPAVYTFEINAGEVSGLGITIGDTVRFHNITSELAACCESGACDE